MKIYLVRHGIAQDRLGGAVMTDADRPLTDEGKSETKAVAHGLRKIGVRADLIVSSPLVRTRQTAEIIKDVLGNDDEIKFTDSMAPGGDPRSVFKFLRQFTHVDEMFLVGHEPDMGRLAAALIWAGNETEIPFKKAGVCRVDVSDVPPTMPGTLKWFITPKIATMIGK